LPVFGSTFLEYSRYWPELSLRIMLSSHKDNLSV